MHYTAGASAESSIASLTSASSQASAHLVVGRDGAITQLVDFNRKAWHAGRSRWEGRSGVNAFSIGIELDNAGKLDGGPGAWRTWFGRSVSDDEVLEARHRNGGPVCGWHRYPEPQIEVAVSLACSLVDHYGLTDIVGHEDVAPSRKTDPGPAFPLASVCSAAMGRRDDGPELYETTTALNIRGGPSTDYEKLEASPLAEGTVLESHGASGVWHEVDVLTGRDGPPELSGWVHGRYLRRLRAEPAPA